jgi:hypothetical protein
MNVLPVPGAQNFRYHRPFRLGSPDKTKVAAKKHPSAAGAKAKDPATTGSIAPPPAVSRPRVGHQLTVVRPPMNLSSPSATVSR